MQNSKSISAHQAQVMRVCLRNNKVSFVRSDHVTGVTEDGLVLTCGGEAADGTDDLSCLALDVAGGQWIQHSVLNVPRIKATSVAVPGVGLYVIGGFKQLSTELLPVGGDTWTWGPTLPGSLEETSYYGICSVLFSETQFMVIGGDGEGMIGGTRVSVPHYFIILNILTLIFPRCTLWRQGSGSCGLI